jgi:AcrR family transcriptional regulator
MMPIAAVAKAKKSGAGSKAKVHIEPIRDAERTQQAILAAAEKEFASKGLAGARVDIIAERAGANKRMLYYYFNSKENLYLAVLERAYGAMRQVERMLNLTDLDPIEAVRKLVEFKFDYYQSNPTIIPLLAAENMHSAKHLRRSRNLSNMHLSLVDSIQKVLAAGEKKGVIRAGIDPLHLYVSISALSYFYFSNSATLSTAFGRDLATFAERKLRRRHCVEVILSYVKRH